MNNFENCGYYTDGECNICGMGTDGEDTFCKYCKDNPNCYYKQLTELKAENERLKEEIKEVKKYQYEQEFLEKEIEELKKRNDKIIVGYIKLSERYKQTLQEIKAIAEFHITDADSEDVQNDMKQILDLITKAEEE